MSDEGGDQLPEHRPIFSPLEAVGEVVLEGSGAVALMLHLAENQPNVFLVPAGIVMIGSGAVYGIYKVVKWIATK